MKKNSSKVFKISKFTSLFFTGGLGGIDQFSNGEGGWSYYNPDAVLKVLDARMNPIHSVVHLAATGNQANPSASLPQLWSNQGHGQVCFLSFKGFIQ